jgi:hypothetical protein
VEDSDLVTICAAAGQGGGGGKRRREVRSTCQTAR